MIHGLRTILFVAAAAAAAGVPMIADNTKPVRLEARQVANHVEVLVIGTDASTSEARYELEIVSTGTGGVTRTVQSGTRRAGSAASLLLRSRIGVQGLSRWDARLRVQTAAGDYVETRSIVI